MKYVGNERGHQIEKRLLVIEVEQKVGEVRLIVVKLKATLIHRYAPRRRIDVLEQINLRGVNQRPPAEPYVGYRCLN